MINSLPVLLICIFVFLRSYFYLDLLTGKELYFQSDDAIYAILSQRLLNGDFFSAFNP